MEGARGFRNEAYMKYAAVTESEAQRSRCRKIGNPEGFQILMNHISINTFKVFDLAGETLESKIIMYSFENILEPSFIKI